MEQAYVCPGQARSSLGVVEGAGNPIQFYPALRRHPGGAFILLLCVHVFILVLFYSCPVL